jgi:ketosteroid isomerase-like protein
MSTEARQHLLEQAVKGMNARDWEAYGRVFAEDVVVSTPGASEPVRGRAARVQSIAALMEAFPDGIVETTRSFATGDLNCVECMFIGTHTGPLTAADGSVVPATNARVRFPYCVIMRFEGDEVVEVHEYYDQLELLLPLGLMKPAGA